jgi:parallel beta-helix repeat protein
MNAVKPGTGGIVNESHSHVTIENGRITDFYFSAAGSEGGTGNVYRKLKIQRIGVGCKQGDICAGIFLTNAKNSLVTNDVITNQVHSFQTNGIDVFAAPGTRIVGSRVGPNNGEGIAIFQSPKTKILRNELLGNRDGMDANNGSDAVRVVGNRAHGNSVAGIAVGAVRGARVQANLVYGNGDDGLFLFDLQASVVRGNRATGNYTGIHLYGGLGGVAGFGGKKGPSNDRLVGNTSTGNKYAGIWVKGDNHKFEAEHNVLSGNKANGNGRAGGIVVQGSVSANRLQGNTANANTGHGIAAAHGSIDGGGNRARSNRRRPQCVGVRCR